MERVFAVSAAATQASRRVSTRHARVRAPRWFIIEDRIPMGFRFLAGVFTVSALLAQQPIRVNVNEVVVPVTVTDDKGRFVSNLEQKDFQIFDQGKEQTIGYFTRE